MQKLHQSRQWEGARDELHGGGRRWPAEGHQSKQTGRSEKSPS